MCIGRWWIMESERKFEGKIGEDRIKLNHTYLMTATHLSILVKPKIKEFQRWNNLSL